jgi:formate dehydrogenase major subunit
MTPLQENQSVCLCCAEGCGFYTLVEQGKAAGIEYMKGHPVNAGALCLKGNSVLATVYHPERIHTPMARQEDGTFQPLAWDEAIALISSRFRGAATKHGPQALAFMASACCTNEEHYLLQKLAMVLGTNNITCPALEEGAGFPAAALAPTLGYAGMTNPLADLANAQCIIITGSHFLENHPVAARFVFEARARGATVICADHRVPPAPWFCDTFLHIRPGSQSALLEGMVLHLLENRLCNGRFIEERTAGFEAFGKAMQKQSLKLCEGITGVPAAAMRDAAERYASARSASLVQTADYNASPESTGAALRHAAHLALLTGHLGRPGAGIFPLLTHGNELGSYDMNMSPRIHCGQTDGRDQAFSSRITKLWKIKHLPSKEGIPLHALPKAIKNHRIKAMYLMEADPCTESSAAAEFQSALKALDFLVVQDRFLTDTAQQADLVLPAPCWAEKTGTYTNTERRVQWQWRIINPQKQMLAAWQVICAVGKKMGFQKQFSYGSPESILSEINKAVPAYAGITPTRVKKFDGIIAPCPATKHPGTPILYTEGFSTSDGRAHFIPPSYDRKEEKPTKTYPFRLTCGPINTALPVAQVATSPSAAPLSIEINPRDAKKMLLLPRSEVKIVTKSGSVKATACVSDAVLPGVVFIPFPASAGNDGSLHHLDPRIAMPQLHAQTCQVKKSGGM